MIQLFNSFSSKIEFFEPFQEGLVKIFICGPTLYDYTHLGHSRIFLTYDLLCRLLQDKGYQTDVLVNMTDINQNVFNKAKLEASDPHAIANLYASKFFEDLNILNITSISRFAFVSDYVHSIEKHISELLERNIAYSANGNVYLDTSKLETYGTLSKQSRDQLLMHRLDIGPNKKSQEDIMLWDCSDDFAFSWKSKFGTGIPWWHMQDTTVALENFGNNYDIHGGARELAYPHHESHLVQYQLLTGNENPVKLWMHVGLVFSDGEKMSKSLGNVVLVRDVAHRYGHSVLRLYLYSTHYRSDIDFNENDLASTEKLYEKILMTNSKTSSETDNQITKLIGDFFISLDDDLNSSKAIEILDEICTDVIAGKCINKNDLTRICQVLGIEL